LRGKIVEKYGTQRKFAKEMKWSERTLSLKLSGKIEWKQSEMVRAKELLGLTDDEMIEIFFEPRVQMH
jgi:hypothetical protein